MRSHDHKPATLREQMLRESLAMARYALASGMPVPTAAADALEKLRFADPGEPVGMGPLVKAHDQLSRLVAPATPRALLAMGDEHVSTSRIEWLGSVPLVRRMLAASMISVVVFVALSITKVTNTDSGPALSFANSYGWPLLANELFWMSSAGIGASFAMLMQVNGYIVKRTYDPKYEPTYWIKFILGVMAGFILVALVPIPENAARQGGGSMLLPTLAMLGGFSASAVYRVLAKLVESAEAVFRGSAADELAQRERAAQTRAAEEMSQARMKLAAQVVSLQQQVSAGADPATLTQALSGVLQSLAPTDRYGETLVPTTPVAETPAPAPHATAATVALPNIPIVSAPEAPAGDELDAYAPAAATDAPSAPADEPQALAPAGEPADTGTPAAAYVGGDAGEDMSDGGEAGESESLAAAATDAATGTGAVG